MWIINGISSLSPKRLFFLVLVGSLTLVFFSFIFVPDYLRNTAGNLPHLTPNAASLHHGHGVKIALSAAVPSRKVVLSSSDKRTIVISIVPPFDASGRPSDRLNDLTRTCNSLLKANFNGSASTNLRLNLDLDMPRDAIEFASNLKWPYGMKSIRYRIKNQDRVASATYAENWFPSQPGEHGIILREGAVVSPAFFMYFLQTLDMHYRFPDSKVVGICMGEPDGPASSASESIPSDKVDFFYMKARPCLSGALFMPQPWVDTIRDSITWLQQPASVEILAKTEEFRDGDFKNSLDSDKFINNLMTAKDQYMIYPNFLGESSTLMNERSSKIKNRRKEKSGDGGDGALFELPHNESAFDFPLSFKDIKTYDAQGRQVISLGCLREGEGCYTRQPQRPALNPQSRVKVCESLFAINAASNTPKETNRVTLIIDARVNVDTEILTKQIEYYGRSAMVSAILVLWNDYENNDPPPLVRVGDVFVTFVPLESKNSRFIPSSKITTDPVIMIDGGIRVHLDDIEVVYRVWLEHRKKMVGFFPGLYRVSSGKSGYAMMKPTFVMLHRYFLEKFSCDESMAYVHSKVDQFGGCEDIAMSFFVTNDVKGPSPIFVHPLHSVIRFGPKDGEERAALEPSVHRECTKFFATLILGTGRDLIPIQNYEVLTRILPNAASKVELELTIVSDSEHKGNRHRHNVEVRCEYDETQGAWKVTENSEDSQPFALNPRERDGWCKNAWEVDSPSSKSFEYSWKGA